MGVTIKWDYQNYFRNPDASVLMYTEKKKRFPKQMINKTSFLSIDE